MALRGKLKQSPRDRERVMRKKSARKFQRTIRGPMKSGLSKKIGEDMAGEKRSMPARGKKRSYVTKNAGRVLHPGKPKWKK